MGHNNHHTGWLGGLPQHEKGNVATEIPTQNRLCRALDTGGLFLVATCQFFYSIARHSTELMTIGHVIMVATPVMLAVGYYILNHSIGIKLFYTALILAFFAILLSHQVLAQAFIMQHLSVLFMPVLYLRFGAVFNALVFVALYSWVIGNPPANATI